MDIQSKLFIFKKPLFWIITIPLILLIVISIILVPKLFFSNDKSGDKPFSFNKNNSQQEFNESVVKHFTPESGTAFKYASPLLYNDHIYIGTSERIGYDNAKISEGHDNFFYKFDLDLNVIWQYPTYKKMIIGGAVMDTNHNLYFVVELLNDKNNTNKKDEIYSDTYLMSLTEDGKFRWEKTISVVNEKWDHASLTPAISTDDIIYIAHDRFYAFDVDGNIISKYPTSLNQRIINYSGSPVIDEQGNVYFTAPSPVASNSQYIEWGIDVIKAFKFTPGLQKLVWATTMGNYIKDNEGGNPNGGGGQKSNSVESSPALGVNGKSLFAITGCTISKIDTQTGELLWSLKPTNAPGHINASPVIDGNNNLYVGSKSNNESRFFAIDSNGKELWNVLVGSDLYNSPIIGDDGAIYVGSETNDNGKFRAFDMKTGEIKWAMGKNDERKIPDFTHDGGLLYKGYFYVGVHSAGEGNEDGTIDPTFYKIKINAYDYLQTAAWPRIYGGNSNTGRQ